MTDAANPSEGNQPTGNQATAPADLLARMVTFLTGEGWPVEYVGEQLLARSVYQGQHGEWPCLVHVRADVDQCLFYSVAPLAAPEVLRPAVAEFLTRANWGLLLGNFELDYTDGEVRYKTSIQLNGTALTDQLLHPLVYGNVQVMDRYLPGLQAVIALAQTPVGAIRLIEEG